MKPAGPTALPDCRLKDQRTVTGPFLSAAGVQGVPVTHEDGEAAMDGRRREEGPRGFMVSNFYGVTNMRVPCHLYLQVQVAGH